MTLQPNTRQKTGFVRLSVVSQAVLYLSGAASTSITDLGSDGDFKQHTYKIAWA
jgi:hypothetical protein